jgi:hypothetical protein
MREIKTISIKCESNEYKNIAELTELQGNLKHREDIDYDKIKLSIIKYGFSFPFFYTEIGGKNYILDGHGRFNTLCKMQKDGYIIPDLPCVKVECKDLKEAKQKLLRLNSQYGKMTKESVLEFAEDIDLNFDEIALPDTIIDFTDDTDAVEDFPELKEGDRDTQCTMTFVLSQEQVEVIKEALKKCGPVQDDTNTNGNGNKLAEICKEYLLNV